MVHWVWFTGYRRRNNVSDRNLLEQQLRLEDVLIRRQVRIEDVLPMFRESPLFVLLLVTNTSLYIFIVCMY